MKLTAELLNQYNACGEGANWFLTTYPNGAELEEVINNPKCDLHFMHWGYHYLPYTPEEKQLYLERARVKNSRFVYDSEDVIDSQAISYGQHITNSQFIGHSSLVKDSKEIYNSEDITNSTNIFRSKKIINSHFLDKSEKIKYSQQILDSSMVTTSYNILSSMIINDSAYIWKSVNVTRSFFGAFLTNVHNTICCSGLDNVNNMIFNEQVSDYEFAQYYTQLKMLLKANDYPSKIIGVYPNIHSDERKIVQSRFDKMIQGVSSEILDFIKALPSYSDEKFEQLLFTNLNKSKKDDIINTVNEEMPQS